MKFNIPFFLSGLVALAWMLLIGSHGRVLKNELAPNGIINYELAGSPSQVAAINDHWLDAGELQTAITNTWLDFGFLIAYSLFFFLGVQHYIARNGSAYLLQKRKLILFLALLPGLLDVIENLFLLRWLNDAIDGFSPGFVFIIASLKFAIAAALLFVCLVGWIKNFGLFNNTR